MVWCPGTGCDPAGLLAPMGQSRAGLLEGVRAYQAARRAAEPQAQLFALTKQPAVLSARVTVLTLGLGLNLIGLIAFHLSAFLRRFN